MAIAVGFCIVMHIYMNKRVKTSIKVNKIKNVCIFIQKSVDFMHWGRYNLDYRKNLTGMEITQNEMP